MLRLISKLKSLIPQSGIFNHILLVLRFSNRFLNAVGTDFKLHGYIRSFNTISSSRIGMAATTWSKSDILYTATDKNQRKTVDALLFSLVAINEQNVRMPVTDCIRDVRECIYEFVFNCLYYRINIGNIGETNLNNFFHFANVDSKTDPDVIKACKELEEKRLS